MVSNMDDKQKIIIVIATIVLILLCCFIGYTLMNSNNKETLQINDMNIKVDEWGIYNLVGHITPLKDFDYLEARVIFYDANGTVIGNGYAWNMLHPQKGTPISINNPAGACKETPAYAIVSFYDAAGSDKAIANFTVTFTDDGNNSTNNTNKASNSNSNNDLIPVKSGDGSVTYFHVGEIISQPTGYYRVNADGSLTKVADDPANLPSSGSSSSHSSSQSSTSSDNSGQDSSQSTTDSGQAPNSNVETYLE